MLKISKLASVLSLFIIKYVPDVYFMLRIQTLHQTGFFFLFDLCRIVEIQKMWDLLKLWGRSSRARFQVFVFQQREQAFEGASNKAILSRKKQQDRNVQKLIFGEWLESRDSFNTSITLLGALHCDVASTTDMQKKRSKIIIVSAGDLESFCHKEHNSKRCFFFLMRGNRCDLDILHKTSGHSGLLPLHFFCCSFIPQTLAVNMSWPLQLHWPSFHLI